MDVEEKPKLHSSHPMGDEARRLAPINTLDITAQLGYQTFRRQLRKPWSREEDELLTQLVQRHFHPQVDLIKWDLVAELLPHRRAKDCRKRWCNSLDPMLKKGRWTVEEDRALMEAHARLGPSWQRVQQEIPGRTDDQCAKRYIEVLDPSTRDRLRRWTPDEDMALIQRVKRYGTKWRTISGEMAGRPLLTCRNRWRKIVTDVARGKASSEIAKAVEEANRGVQTEEEEQQLPAPAAPPPPQTSTWTAPAAPLALPQSYVVPAVPTSTGTTTNWKYSLEQNGEAVTTGDISSHEMAAALVANAKRAGLTVTVHQHIHHHYQPNSTQRLEPETQLTRYQHFNYLLPEAELPRLASSGERSATSNERAAPLGDRTARSPDQPLHKRQKVEAVPEEDHDEDLDFWEVLATQQRSGTNSRQETMEPPQPKLESQPPFLDLSALYLPSITQMYDSALGYEVEVAEGEMEYGMYYSARGGEGEGREDEARGMLPYNPS